MFTVFGCRSGLERRGEHSEVRGSITTGKRKKNTCNCHLLRLFTFTYVFNTNVELQY